MDDDNKNKLKVDNSVLSEILVDGQFSKLDKDLQHKIIDIVSVKYNSSEKDGKISDLLGNKSNNISLYVAGLICGGIIIIGFVYILLPNDYKKDSNIEFWNLIVPIITSTLGYIFGKSKNDK